MKEITTKTQLCAVIGNPVSHSLSPAIHNSAFKYLGLDFVYIACPVEDVKAALTGMRALGNFRGMSVTIPHKIDAMNCVDEVNEVDQSIGSINTVINDGGKLRGIGTDGAGALKAFQDIGIEIDGKNVLIIGAGGVSRAIAFTLAKETNLNKITLLDINLKVLEGLGSDLRSGTNKEIETKESNKESLAAAMESADIIINCTPLGMHPKVEMTPVPAELFKEGQVCFDAVYTPLETRFLAEAKAKGLQTISGVEMFVNQAALQFKEFTGVEAPVEVMRKVVMDHLTK